MDTTKMNLTMNNDMQPTLIIDQEFKSLIPPLATGDLAQLEQNILADGCRDPIVLWNDVIVDGHNRFAICKRHKIKFQTVAKEFASRDDAKIWIIENQFGRRNLADIDRISLAVKREDIIRGKAKENQKQSGGDRKSVSAKMRQPVRQPIKTSKESAKSAGVGERTYDAGKAILEAVKAGEVSEEDIEAIRRKEKSIHRVAKDLKEKRSRSKRDTQRKSAAGTGLSRLDNVHVGDFRKISHNVEDGSLSLIFTDPPYDRKSIELFDGLGEFAASKLCDGGSLLCYVGHIQTIDALNALSRHLRYWWQLCCLHSGPNSLMREYGIRVGWKPVLWFVKGTRNDKEDIVSDVMSGGREKSHHDWQQSQSEAEYWIDHLCPKDGIVCDPFLGGGTTAAAAIALQRRWVGFEIDPEQAAIAMQRMQSVNDTEHEQRLLAPELRLFGEHRITPVVR